MRNCLYRTYDRLPDLDEGEILRYAGIRGEADEGLRDLLKACVAECAPRLSYRTCFRVLSVEELFAKVEGAVNSVGLKAALGESEGVVVFAATVGGSLDRLLARYGAVSPSKALLLQAIGAERIECLCDTLCADLQKEFCEEGLSLGRRYSPGYGDFSLSAQRDIFRLLDAEGLGLRLTEGLTMLPTKSVTAIVGVGRGSGKTPTCRECNKKDCEFRR